jgi:hypothetical protein
MPRFELTHFVTNLQKRCFQVEAADTANARARVLNSCSHGVIVGREAVLFRTQLDCKEVAATAAPTNVKAATDADGCLVWVPV